MPVRDHRRCGRQDGLDPLGLEGIEAILFRTIGDQPSLRESLLPDDVLQLPEELARVDALLDDPVFIARSRATSTR